MEACDREGTFRAEIADYGLQEGSGESKSVGVRLRVNLLELWHEEAWHDWRPYQMEAFGSIWIVKKDGTANDNGVASLVKNAGWDADLSSVVNSSWEPKPCQVVIKAEEYKGQTTYKVAFLNGYDDDPNRGALSTVSPDKAKELQAKYGSAFKAIKGNVARNSAPGNGSKPSAPPKPTGVPVSNAARAESNKEEGIPF